MDEKLQMVLNSFGNQEDRAFIEEAMKIHSEAENEGILLRFLGALAFRIQCPKNALHFEALERRITDIDFAASTNNREKLIAFFEQRGYVVDENVLHTGGGFRYIFENPQNGKHVDIFFDQLEMCHTVVFKDRLDIDNWTISLADLLLEKMQIVEITMKDLKDASILLLEHDIGQDDRTIDMGYIGKIMSNNWGFYYTFTSNLNKVRDALSQFNSLGEGEKNLIDERIQGILDLLVKSKKSLKWRARAKIGAKMKWYRQVD